MALSGYLRNVNQKNKDGPQHRQQLRDEIAHSVLSELEMCTDEMIAAAQRALERLPIRIDSDGLRYFVAVTAADEMRAVWAAMLTTKLLS